MNALANKEVGTYMSKHFVCTYQRVGTFKIVNNAKQGGNVASYFCKADRHVLHALAGPVDAKTFLREARWAVETSKHAALLAGDGPLTWKAVVRKAHLDRLAEDHNVNIHQLYMPNAYELAALLRGGPLRGNFAAVGWLDNQGKTHHLLATYPLVELGRIYHLVFTDILNEEVSTLPVAKR